MCFLVYWFFPGPIRGPFSSIWHYSNSGCPFHSFFRPFGAKPVFKRHRPKFSQMVCMLCMFCSSWTPKGVWHAKCQKSGQQSRLGPQACTISGLKHQFDKWHLFRAPTGICCPDFPHVQWPKPQQGRPICRPWSWIKLVCMYVCIYIWIWGPYTLVSSPAL